MTPEDFALRMKHAADNVDKAAETGLRDGGALMRRTILAQAAGPTRGTLALRGTGGRRKSGAPKLKVTEDFRNTSLGPVLLLGGQPRGVWSMLDSGTAPHLIGVGAGRSISLNVKTRKVVYTKVTKTGRTTQTSKRKRIRIGDRWITGPIMAGGSKAHHTFKYGVQRAEPQLLDAIADSTHKATVAALRGRP